MKLTLATSYLLLAALGAMAAAPDGTADGVASRDIEISALHWEYEGKRDVYDHDDDHDHDHEAGGSAADSHTLGKRQSAFYKAGQAAWRKSADWYFSKALDIGNTAQQTFEKVMAEKKGQDTRKIKQLCGRDFCVAAPAPAAPAQLNAEYLQWKRLGCRGQQCAAGVNLKKKVCVGVKGSCSSVIAEVRKFEAAQKKNKVGGTGTSSRTGKTRKGKTSKKGNVVKTGKKGKRVKTPGSKSAKKGRPRTGSGSTAAARKKVKTGKKGKKGTTVRTGKKGRKGRTGRTGRTTKTRMGKTVKTSGSKNAKYGRQGRTGSRGTAAARKKGTARNSHKGKQ